MKNKNICIVCQNFIAAFDRRQTKDGPVHSGYCQNEYEKQSAEPSGK